MININELKFDEKGLIPAIVVDSVTKKVLTLAYMNKESLEIPMEKETAALGAACIAGITTGALESPESMREKSKIKKIML